MNTTLPLQQRIYEMLMESQYWPPEQMLEYQRSQLSQLLRHAKATVPFYKTRLDVVFKKNGDIDWDRWNEIPIVTRSDLRDRRAEMLAITLPPGHGETWEVNSSGSSGVPIVATHNQLAGWVSMAVVYRAGQWHGINYGHNFVSLLSDHQKIARWPEGKQTGLWGPVWLDENKRGMQYMLDRTAREDQIFEFSVRKGARYISGRPITLQSLATWAERMNSPISFDTVITHGNGVRSEEREDFERLFGARVMSYYSSAECYKMGISCETGSHYHINSEQSVVEIVDDYGNPCSIGQLGRVVITPLFSTAQPLIRYEQGDIAIRGTICSCGKTLPVLQEISGRVDDLFQLPDGRKIVVSLEGVGFSSLFGSKMWQLAQTELLTVEMRYVQTDANATLNFAFAQEVIREKVHQDIHVKFVELGVLPLTLNGKFFQYKSEIPVQQ